mgnify:CR=1 FL=1
MNTPKIRFKGFTDDWEQRKLGDVCSRVQGNDGRMELPTLTISAGNGWMRQEDRFSGNIAGKEQKNYTLLRKGELSYNHGNSKLAKYGTVFSLQTYEEALVPRVYHSFKVKEGNCDFVEYYFATKLPDRELSKLISSGARMDGLLNIGYDEFMGIQMKFPSTLEQRKISLYFRKLDHLITLHQRKCDETKELKKFMLQKMFPKNGEKNPEIRFEGFTDDWEQRKLGEIALQTYGGGTPKTANEEFWKGNIPWIQSSDLLEERLFNVKPRKYISQEAISKSSTKLVPQNSIAIVTRVGVGKLAFMPFSYATSQDFLSFSELKIEPEFAVYALYKMMRLVSNEVQGTSIKGITKDELLAKEILIPDCEEQKKIGAYLHNLDHLITLHQRKCEKLKELKKFMLQNMFV